MNADAETERLGTPSGGSDEGAPARGASCGRFLILEPLGLGGMGMVLAAYDPQLDRRVALKLLRPDRRLGDDGGRRARTSLLREAQAMARLSHPNVVTVFEAGLVPQTGQVFVAMELVPGETLRDWCRRQVDGSGGGDGEVPWRRVLDAYLAAGRGLAAAHAAGLVHRDFKPDNVLVAPDGRVRVSDFGLASVSACERDDQPGAELTEGELLRGLTVEGAVMGTPAYMAPEQHEGRAVDARADQFAFCVSLWEALHQERPFAARRYTELVAAVKGGFIKDPGRSAGVPSWVKACLLRGLSARPDDRYPDMEALLLALSRDPLARRRRLAAAGLLGGTAAAVAAAVAFLVARGGGVGACGGARQHLAGVWDAGVERVMQQRFAATGERNAPAIFQRVAGRLSAYTDRWVAMHTSACQATHVRGEQSPQLLDRRMACLTRRRGELLALTEALKVADAQAVNRAVQAVVNLEPVDACADTEALLTAVPPPSNPELARKVAELDADLHRLQTSLQLGKGREVQDEARALLARAEATGYARSRSIAHWLLAETLFAMHEVGGAEKHLLQMARAAAEARDDRLVSRALGRLSMVYHLAEQSEKAVSMAQAAELAARRAGDDESLAYAQISAVNSLQALGRLDEAHTAYQAATATIERFQRSAEPARLIYPLMHLGMGSYLGGRYVETNEVFARVLRMHLDIHGMDNQRTPELMRYSAIMVSKVGTLPQALDLARRGTDYFEKRGAPGVSDHVLLLIDVAIYLRQMGRLDEAEAYLARIRPLAEAPDQLTSRGGYLQIEADVLMARRRYREAEHSLRRARDAGALTRDHVGVALLVRTARALAGQGRRREARAQFAEAVDLAAKVLPPDHPATLTARIAAAAMEVEESDRGCAQALPTATAVVAALEPRVGQHSALLVDPLTLQGRCLVAGKRADQAVPVLQRALDVAARAGVDPEKTTVARQWLARATARNL